MESSLTHACTAEKDSNAKMKLNQKSSFLIKKEMKGQKQLQLQVQVI